MHISRNPSIETLPSLPAFIRFPFRAMVWNEDPLCLKWGGNPRFEKSLSCFPVPPPLLCHPSCKRGKHRHVSLYYSTQELSAKSDVFSFGVVVLEIVSGREPLNILGPRNKWSLVKWAKTFTREARIEEIVDPTIKVGYHAEATWRVVELALACIETFAAYRPCMDDIVRELEDAFIIENNASEYMKTI